MPTDSPEDRLLSLIKGKYKNGRKNQPSAQGSGGEALAEAGKKIFLKNKGMRAIFSDSINRILAIVLMILLGYLGYSLVFPAYRNIDLGGNDAFRPGESGPERKSALAAPVAEDYSTYSRAIGGRSLFSAPFDEGSELERTEPEVDLSARFNLVGIIAGEDPQAIIEDKDAKKTHYLYAGQNLNGVSVAEITEGKVVLVYKGREVVLVL